MRRRPRWAPVELFHINRRELFQLRIADSRGRPVKGAQKRFDRFFRCHHTDHAHRMDGRLIRLIYQVGQHYDGRRIEVISGYRDPSVAKNAKSPHKEGLACDFRVEGVPNQELRDYLRKTFDHVGVGYYPNSSFVHLDVRTGPSAFWIDYSAPGKNAMYADNPLADLKSGRAETFKPASIDPSWARDGAGEGGAPQDEGEGGGCCVEPDGPATSPEAPRNGAP
ncbi:MAG: DUF882 domain-containing protein [Myxococcales bacterium]|nr:DUF882 domain-containing protein [Myxococcales bacterium]